MASPLRSCSPLSLLSSVLASFLFAVCLTAGHVKAEGHFRYATVFWEKTDDATSNTVEITVESAWRRSYQSAYFVEAVEHGNTLLQINGAVSPVIDLGDGSLRYLDAAEVTAYSEAEDWLMAKQVFTHTYATPNHRGAPWTVAFSGCCRVEGGENGGDGSWRLEATIDLLLSLSSPRIVSLPVVFIQDWVPDFESFSLSSSRVPPNTRIQWALSEPASSLPSERLSLFQSSQSFYKATVNINAAMALATTTTALLHVGAHARHVDTQGNTLSTIPVELLVNISASNARPKFNAATLSLFSSPVIAMAGFERKVTVGGSQAVSASSDFSNLSVGFTVGRLPEGMMASTVRGRGRGPSDEATMELRWSPCVGDIGSYTVCIDIVNSLGLADTAQCMELRVQRDPPPTLRISLFRFLPNGTSAGDLYIGRRYTFLMVATDSNEADALMLEPTTPPCAPSSSSSSSSSSASSEAGGCPMLPPDAVLLPTMRTQGNGSVTSTREMVFAPKHNHGGYNQMHCFKTTDACGVASPRCNDEKEGDDASCPGVASSAVACVLVHVRRCAFVVRSGQTLEQIAQIYKTDWLQLWSHNGHIEHPDAALTPGSVLSIGRPYDVQPYDTAEEVVERFGMSMDLLQTLNADVTGSLAQGPVCTSMKE
eukprot:CAMPEP_0181303672 /NCGR_PEP_ID=MMETSP1101-20121128/8694_1 /TAXON_ID=46948 /ORGANISM="Rhodomonas abbreviata, Strain Caron Lab Isolate" /LENGTH=652 /DNA_ID=CAMNT_0023409283 /DNA_START=91 /DNA_END=2046 /DNA_ORIENTATION=-